LVLENLCGAEILVLILGVVEIWSLETLNVVDILDQGVLAVVDILILAEALIPRRLRDIKGFLKSVVVEIWGLETLNVVDILILGVEGSLTLQAADTLVLETLCEALIILCVAKGLLIP